MGRPPIKKSGPMTATEHQRRWRRKLAREKKLANPKLRLKQERREAHERDTAAKILALPDKQYGVIYADPEWRFKVWSVVTGSGRSAANHFSTSFTKAIKARPIETIAAKNCVLFLWATAAMELHAHEVMAAWSFTYKSQIIWEKPDLGTGYWFREKHELLLVGTRRKIPAPAPGKQWPSVIQAPRGAGKFSEKPAIFAEMIEAYFPNLPKIELNCRGKPRPGWDAWGAEVEG
jgi:N6-adenosine-specific RNA methylase IME4